MYQVKVVNDFSNIEEAIRFQEYLKGYKELQSEKEEDYQYECLCKKDNCNIWGQAEHEKTEVDVKRPNLTIDLACNKWSFAIDGKEFGSFRADFLSSDEVYEIFDKIERLLTEGRE